MAIKQFYPEISPSLNLDFANSKIVDPRITFTRASTATYYCGKTVVKAEENLFTYSQQLSNASWLKSNITVADNAAVAPDGTTTAARIQTSGAHYISKMPGLATGLTYVMSFYVKSNTGVDQTFSSIYGDGVQPTHVATYEWTRIVRVVTNTGYGTIYPIGNNDTAAPALDLLVWGFQLEQRDQATAYTPTTDRPITRYQPVLLTASANTPRIDHDPITGECRGLLIEESRTNLLTYSEQFDNAAWTKSNSTIGSNVMVAPDGTLTADKLILSNSASYQGVSYTSSGTGDFTFSVIAKKAEFTYLKIKFQSGTCALNFDTGAVTSNVGTASATSLGGGYFRFSVTRTGLSGGWNVLIWASNSSTLYTSFNTEVVSDADGYKGVYIWGAQLETTSRPSSYIKTEASQVTRAAESVSTSLGQVGQGTFYVNSTVVSGNTLITSGSTTFAATASTEQKTAVAYDASSTRRSINGAAVTSAAGSQGGSSISIAPSANGYIKKVSLYPQKLSDINLVALTT